MRILTRRYNNKKSLLLYVTFFSASIFLIRWAFMAAKAFRLFKRLSGTAGTFFLVQKHHDLDHHDAQLLRGSWPDKSSPQEANCHVDLLVLAPLTCNRFACLNAKPDMQQKTLSAQPHHFNLLKAS